MSIFANQVMIIFALKEVTGHSLQEFFSTGTKFEITVSFKFGPSFWNILYY